VADFGDALPFWRILTAPESERINVEILPVQIDSLFVDKFDSHGRVSHFRASVIPNSIRL